MYSQIKSRAAATAKVVVLGYPRIFNGEDCNAGTCFSPDDESRLNATADLLVEHDLGRAAAYGFTFKSVIPAFIGHAVCDSTGVAERALEPGRRQLPPEPHSGTAAATRRSSGP